MTAAAVDASMEAISLRRGRLPFSGKKSTIRRNLFGVEPGDRESVNSFLKEQLDKIREDEIKKWNFDFNRDCPLEGDYKWEEAGSDVPDFYKAKVVVSTIAKRTADYESSPSMTTCCRDSSSSSTTSNVKLMDCTLCAGQSTTRPNWTDPCFKVPSTPSNAVQPTHQVLISTPKTPSTTECSKKTCATQPAKRQREITEFLPQRKRRRLALAMYQPSTTKVSKGESKVFSPSTV